MAAVKLTIAQPALAAGLAAVRPAVALRPPYGATDCCLLTAGEGELRLEATDLTLGLARTVAADVREPGQALVVGRVLDQIVRGLTGTLELAATARRLDLAGEGRTAALVLTSPERFPPLPRPEETLTTLLAAELRAGITRVIHAVADEKAGRPALTGVCLDLDGATATLAAADGVRLAVAACALVTPVAEPVRLVIPAPAPRALGPLLGAGEVVLSRTPNGTTVGARFQSDAGAALLCAQLLQSQFPDYQRLVPTRHTTRVSVGREDLAGALRFLAVLGRENAGCVRLQALPANGQLVLTVQADEVGEQRVMLPAAVDGEPVKLALNHGLLRQAVAAIPHGPAAAAEPNGPVWLDVNGPQQPAVLHGADETGREVIMPLFVAW
ncbi:MAG TPA: DNA polymerase III subunit beta [Dehalococcoidia bacterium]|nr:DNA polymerase III subunit beta [Dehalococcoidia bacterium]